MSTASDMIAKYLDAEKAVLEGKTVRLGERLLGMEDLEQIRKGRQEWEQRLAREQAGNAAPRIGGVSFSVARMD